jgi:hypothetical protein
MGYQHAGRKEKCLSPDRYVRLTGYNRKYAIRVLSMPLARTAAMAGDGEIVVFKAEKKPGPKNRPCKPRCTGETIACLENIRRFYRYKCGPCPACLIRQNGGKAVPKARYPGTGTVVKTSLLAPGPAACPVYRVKMPRNFF